MTAFALPTVRAAVTVPRAFNAAAIAGLKLDLNADAIGGLADAASVATWPDRSGFSYDLSQGTGSKQPTYRVNAANGRSVVRFGGTDDLLVRAGAPPFTGQSGSLFVVANLASLATTQEVYASADESGSLTDRLDLSVTTAGKLQLVGRVGGGTNNIVVGDSTLVTGTTYVVEAHSSGSTWSLYVNGVAQSLTVTGGTNTGDWYGDMAALDNVVVGGFKHTSEILQITGDVARVLYYDQAVAADDRQRIARALGALYGAAVA